MVYLLLNVVFASAFTLCIKWVQVRAREDILVVGAVNYLVAAALTLPEFLWHDSSSTPTVAASAGATMGVCYFVAFFLLIHAVRWIGAASSTVIGVLSIIVPIACGILIWQEQPNAHQVLGVVLALISLALIGGKRPADFAKERPWFTPLVLVSFFLLAGTSRLAQEVFKHVCEPDQRPIFLFAAFVTTALPSLVILIVKVFAPCASSSLWRPSSSGLRSPSARRGEGTLVAAKGRAGILVGRHREFVKWEFLIGGLMGLANILQSHFILKSLEHFDGFVVFPFTSAGGLVLTTVVATRMLGERLHRRTYWGIFTAVLALFLLHWVG